jgi:glycerophosphoryl diester phosphodiesterase
VLDEGDESTARLRSPTTLIADARKAGLSVEAWTFRDEPRFLAADYGGDPLAEYRQFYALGVNGVITDFPGTALRARTSASSAR